MSNIYSVDVEGVENGPNRKLCFRPQTDLNGS